MRIVLSHKISVSSNSSCEFRRAKNHPLKMAAVSVKLTLVCVLYVCAVQLATIDACNWVGTVCFFDSSCCSEKCHMFRCVQSKLNLGGGGGGVGGQHMYPNRHPFNENDVFYNFN